jgi:hypothetical protein
MSLCRQQGDVILRCSETGNGGRVLISKWLNINGSVAHKRTMNCTVVVGLRNTGR